MDNNTAHTQSDVGAYVPTNQYRNNEKKYAISLHAFLCLAPSAYPCSNWGQSRMALT